MSPRRSTAEVLQEMYDALYRAYGPQGWWPGRTRTEIVIGAILTQNTNWKNVEKAIARLQAAGLLEWAALRDVPVEELAEQIRPAGYYNVKAKRLKCFVEWLWARCAGDLERLADGDFESLRADLLGVSGIGPETADSILLYALDLPTFVVDAYTARVAGRHGLIEPGITYEELKALYESNLPRNVRLFNEYHALLVAVGKNHCQKRARCAGCPLESFEHHLETE